MPPRAAGPSSLLGRLLAALGASSALLSGCGARTELGDVSPGRDGSGGSSAGAAPGGPGEGGQGGAGGQVGGAGGAAVCDKSQPLPAKDPLNGEYRCPSTVSFGSCQVECYAPSAKTLPGPCVAAFDPALETLPNFQKQACGLMSIISGPYCGEDAVLLGNDPACCYLTFSQPCRGRPWGAPGRARVASLARGGGWAGRPGPPPLTLRPFPPRGRSAPRARSIR